MAGDGENRILDALFLLSFDIPLGFAAGCFHALTYCCMAFNGRRASLPVCLSVCPPACPPACLPARLSTCLFVVSYGMHVRGSTFRPVLAAIGRFACNWSDDCSLLYQA